MVEYTTLGGNLNIARILNGMWQIADMERDGKSLDTRSALDAMSNYVQAGFTTFDMADHYGSAEDICGLFHQQNNKREIQLLTKWVPKPPVQSKDQVRNAIQRSLDRLQVDAIDLLQYHAWNYADPEWLDTLFWLQELKDEGLIQNIGVTNFDAIHLNMALASGIELVSNQISYSLIDNRADAEMRKVCQKHNVKILAYGTLAGGFLHERWLNRPEPEQSESLTWSQMKYKRFIDEAGGWTSFQAMLNELNSIAKSKSVTVPQLSTRYLLDQSHVAGVILGTRFGVNNHIEENLKPFTFQLTQEESQLIEKAKNNLRPIQRNCGDEYRTPPFLTAAGDLSDHLNTLPKVYEPIALGDRTIIDSGTPWESKAGYARAIKKGNRINISGTTATHKHRLIGGADASAQTHFIIDKIQACLESFGASLKDVDRTRIFVAYKDDCEAVALAHGDRFAQIRPANTLVQAGLIGDEYKVEIEAEATINSDG